MARDELYELRQRMMDWTDTLLDFGRIVGSRMSTNVKNVLCDVVGIEMEEGGSERRDNRPLYGHAGVLMRPAAPTAAGSCEIIFARVGDDMIPLANRDIRWQVELEEGEVVVRSLSETPARVRLKPDGSCIVEAESITMESASIKLGSGGASQGVSLGDSLKSWLDNHKHIYVDDSAGAQFTSAPMGGTPTTPAADPSPDPSSKVKVE